MSIENREFSVAISVYRNDTPAFVERALRSITVEQTVPPSEIVLVVDGPVGEDLATFIADFEKETPAARVIRLEENGGLGNALRIAVEAASYDLVARMDSDDVSVPTRFEQQLSVFAEHPETDIVGGDITEFIGEENNLVGLRSVPVTDAEIRLDMTRRCSLNHVSVMFRRSAVLGAGNYIDWFWNEDYYLWIRMLENGAVFANTGTVLVNVRVGVDMYRRRGGMKYYKSEAGLQKYMYKRKMIGFGRYVYNCAKRFAVQVLLPNRLRGWVFQKFARRNPNKGEQK